MSLNIKFKTLMKGTKYYGELKDGIPYGRGIISYKNGDRYQGQFKDGLRDGQGVFIFANGDRYEGEWKENKKHGKGLEIDVEGNLYDGDWKEGEYHGFGVEIYNGSKYIGEWRNGKKSGKGIYYYNNGNKFDGFWVDNKKTGRGIKTSLQGERVEQIYDDGILIKEGDLPSLNETELKQELLERENIYKNRIPTKWEDFEEEIAPGNTPTDKASKAKNSGSPTDQNFVDMEESYSEEKPKAQDKPLSNGAAKENHVNDKAKDKEKLQINSNEKKEKHKSKDKMVNKYRSHEKSKSRSDSSRPKKDKDKMDISDSLSEIESLRAEVARLKSELDYARAASKEFFREIDFKSLQLLKPKLGEGMFGKVYKAKWLGTTVAVKKLRNRASVDTEALHKEFATEVAVLSQLRHPNLVLFLGASTKSGNLCIISEYMENGNLYDFIRDNKLTHQRRLQMAIDIACGMNYMHHFSATGPFIHRDLKSLNILVDINLNLKICDFGLSKLKAPGAQLETQLGTPRWTAPEILAGKKYNEKVDVYSYGILLWELYTTKVPFEGSSNEDVKRLIISGIRPHIPSICPGSYKELVKDCWNPEPEKRPTFDDIVSRLEDLKKNLVSSEDTTDTNSQS